MEKVKEENKKEKLVRKAKSNNPVVINQVKSIVRFICYLATFFASILAILVFIFSIITTLSVANKEASVLLHDNFSMSFISKISASTMEETKLSYMANGGSFTYILFNIILPSIALICAAILVILLCSQILKFIAKINKEKDLFSEKNIYKVENMVNILSVIIFVNWALFNNPSMPFALLIFLLLYIIYYLYKICAKKFSQ